MSPCRHGARILLSDPCRCEVAEVPSLRKHNTIWVAPDEESVVTRFLFAFPGGIAGLPSSSFPASSLDGNFENEVRECIAQLKAAAGQAS